MAPSTDWTDEDYHDARTNRRIQDVTNRSVLPLINAWDGDHVGWLIPGLDAEKFEWGLGSAWSMEYARGVCFALEARLRRADLRWPEPWDETQCPFAFAMDRNGSFLRRRYRRTSHWEVRYLEGRQQLPVRRTRRGSGIVDDQYWTDEDERLLDIDMDLGDLDPMPTTLRKWGDDDRPAGRL